MARLWIEQLDATRHVDHFHAGGSRPRVARREVVAWTYIVEVCGFQFEFGNLEQLKQFLDHYRIEIEPSSRDPSFVLTNICHEKGEWELWHERLPLRLRQANKRPKVMKALERALMEWEKPNRSRRKLRRAS